MAAPAINVAGIDQGGTPRGPGVMPMNLPTGSSPNVGNYRVGRGYLSMRLQGESTYQDMGNCTRFTFINNVTRLDHYSSRVGIRKKDLTVVTQLDAKLTMSLEEATVRNMAMYCLGFPLESATGSVDLMTNPQYYASLNFTDTSSVGPQWNAVFPLVLLSPAAAFQMISEGTGTWSAIDMEGDVLFDQTSGQFGWLYSPNAHP
jgi:hypothetical protein